MKNQDNAEKDTLTEAFLSGFAYCFGAIVAVAVSIGAILFGMQLFKYFS